MAVEERESHTVAVFPLTPLKGRGRGKGEDREERRSGEERDAQGWDDGVERYTGGFL